MIFFFIKTNQNRELTINFLPKTYLLKFLRCFLKIFGWVKFQIHVTLESFLKLLKKVIERERGIMYLHVRHKLTHMCGYVNSWKDFFLNFHIQKYLFVWNPEIALLIFHRKLSVDSQLIAWTSNGGVIP